MYNTERICGQEQSKLEHPINAERRINEALREENRFLSRALLCTQVTAVILAGAFVAVVTVLEKM